MKRILSFIVLATILLSFTSCKKEADNSGILMSVSEAPLYQKDKIQQSDLIVRGKPIKIVSSVMTNPDGSVKGNDGQPLMNDQITQYSFEVSQVYKGTCENEIIVNTRNGYGLPAEYIIKQQENPDSANITNIKRTDLEIGKECVLILLDIENLYTNYDGYSGYYLYSGNHGYYPFDSTQAKFICKEQRTYDDLSFSQDNIAQEISDVLQDAGEKD